MDHPSHFRSVQPGYRWDGVPFLPYKDDGSAPFKDISRQVLFSDPALGCEWRYFEMAAGGYSTLERHEHAHAVMILRGSGLAMVDGEVKQVETHDLVSIPAWAWHQFRATDNAPLGFMCMVNTVRDKPALPTPAERDAMRQSPEVAAFLDGRLLAVTA